MSNTYKNIDIDKIRELAWKYIDECEFATKQVVVNSGVHEVKDRIIPDVRYFLLHWLRRNDFEFYQKSQFYNAMKDDNHPLSDTIKKITEDFKALAISIVANEGKGIFYGKNFLGMHDRQQLETKNVEKFDFE
jgi:hypothetical protein